MSIHATSTEVYSGKNLFNSYVAPNYTLSDGTITVDSDGIISMSGNTRNNGYCRIYTSFSDFVPSLVAGQTYYIYVNNEFDPGNRNYIYLYGSSFFWNSGQPHTVTQAELDANIVLYGGYQATTKITIMVTTTPDTSYEPYVGGVPSPLISGVTHVSTSKNLLNMQSTSNGEYFGTTNQQTYSGKNILNASSPFTVTNSTVYRSIPISIPNGTTVCVQCDSITTNSTTGCSVRFQDSNLAGVGTVILYPGTTLSQSVTLIGDAAYCFVYSSNNYASSQSATTTYTNLMVSKGSTAQSYEPYVGGVPSPSPDYPQEIVTGKLASKNLLDLSTFVKGRVDNGVIGYVNDTTSFSYTDDSITYATVANYRGVVSDFIPVKPNTPYIFSAGSYGGSGVYRDYYDSSKNWISRATTNPQVTPSNCAYMRVNFQYSSTGTTTVSRPMLEEGSVATSFEPYFTPIELTQMGSYQDRVYKSGGNWYVERVINGMKLDSSTNFILYTGVSDTGFTFFKAAVTTSKGQQCISNYFTTSYMGWSNLQNEHIEMLQVHTDDFLYLKTKTSRISSTDALNTWLSNRDVKAYYILATPTNTAITDSATIDWLNKYDTDALPHHKYVNTRRTTYVGASRLASAIDLYDGSYASALPTYTTANDHHLTTANDGTYTVSLQNISASIISGTVTFSVFTNQRKIDFLWNGSATITNVSVSLQADEYIKSIYAYIPQDADAGITLSQQLESGSLTDFEPYYNIVKIYAGDDLVFEDTSLTD